MHGGGGWGTGDTKGRTAIGGPYPYCMVSLTWDVDEQGLPAHCSITASKYDGTVEMKKHFSYHDGNLLRIALKDTAIPGGLTLIPYDPTALRHSYLHPAWCGTQY